jgi:hypothetical protein
MRNTSLNILINAKNCAVIPTTAVRFTDHRCEVITQRDCSGGRSMRVCDQATPQPDPGRKGKLGPEKQERLPVRERAIRRRQMIKIVSDCDSRLKVVPTRD